MNAKKIIISKKNCAAEVSAAITKWSKNTTKLIIAIDGYTGVGKTTLLKRLSRMNSNILAVNRDDFVIPRASVRRLFLRAKDRSLLFEKEILNREKLKRLIVAFKRNARSCTMNTYNYVSGKIDVKKKFDTTKSILVIEGLFLFHPELLDDLWDKRIYLDGEIDTIDRQRVRREKKKWGAEYVPETHPESYIRYITVALKQYRKKYHPEKRAVAVMYLK